MESADAPLPGAPGRRRATAAMVAERAQVSTATVSLVANGKSRGRVSAVNEARVLQAIHELGYVVDGIGSSLSRGVSSTVIMVAPDISNPFFANVIAGVRTALGQDYQLLLSVTDAGTLPSADDTRRLLSLRPAGFLVDAPDEAFLEELSAPDPLVLLDAPGLGKRFAAVNLDVAHGARELAGHLAAAGHRKVAYVDGITGTATFELRRAAFLAAADALGLEVPDAACLATTIDVGVVASEFASVWPAWQQAGVTAVVCATDTHAYGILQEARARGLRVPGDLAVAGFDDLPYSRTSNPSLTSVHLPGEELGRQAAQQLRRLMAGEMLEDQELTLASSLVVRGSTTVD
ncbi:LacI family DNA-binding transcriptional regulator [Arthrobacter rhombi]|uniref:LacI family DNA-binding transcriptional regulator n=1 Tax=Arthrobacter rhombi TaxID=71253 RepID=UPI003FD447CF